MSFPNLFGPLASRRSFQSVLTLTRKSLAHRSSSTSILCLEPEKILSLPWGVRTFTSLQQRITPLGSTLSFPQRSLMGTSKRFMSSRITSGGAAFDPHIKTNYNTLPEPRPDLVLRDDVLEQLEKKLLPSQSSASALKKVTEISVLHAPGGYGKTEIAKAFAHKNKDAFAFIWWVSCESWIMLKNSYFRSPEGLDAEFIKPSKYLSLRERIETVHEALGSCAEPWLLVIDGYRGNIGRPEEALIPTLPKQNGAILVTTQSPISEINQDNHIKVTGFTPEEGAELIERVTGESNIQAMQEISEYLGGVPLLINQAAYSMRGKKNRMQGSPVEACRKRLVEEGVTGRMLENLLKEKVWSLTKRDLPRDTNVCLAFLSMLGPECVPSSWINKLFQEDKNPTSKMALKQAHEHALIKITAKGEVKMHPARAQIILAVMDREEKFRAFKRAGETLAKIGAELSIENQYVQNQSAMLSLWASHASYFMWHFTKLFASGVDYLTDINIMLGQWYNVGWEHDIAKKHLKKALKVSRSQNFSIREARANAALGDSYRGSTEFKYTKALECYKASKEIYEKKGNSYAYECAKMERKIGWILIRQGKKDEEQLGYFRSSYDRVKNLEPSSTYTSLDLADALEGMSVGWHYYGDHELSLSYCNAALEELSTQLPDKIHPRVALSLDNRGVLLAHLGQYDEALENIDEALQIRQQLYPPEKYSFGHPEIAHSLSSKAFVMGQKKEEDRALKYLEETLKIRKALRPEGLHEDIYDTLVAIASIYERKGDFLKAREHYDEILHRSKHRGVKAKEKNLRMLRALTSLGNVSCKEGDYALGLKYYENALDGWAKRIHEKDSKAPNSYLVKVADALGELAKSEYELDKEEFDLSQLTTPLSLLELCPREDHAQIRFLLSSISRFVKQMRT